MGHGKRIKGAAAVLLLTALFLSGCGGEGGEQERFSSQTEASLPSGESGSTASEPPQDEPPQDSEKSEKGEEEKGMAALREMRLLSGRISEKRDAVQKAAQPVLDQEKELEQALQQARSTREEMAEVDSPETAQAAAQGLEAHLGAAEAAGEALSESIPQALEQANRLLEEIKGLEQQAADILDGAEEKRESLSLLLEFIRKETAQGEEALARLEELASSEDLLEEATRLREEGDKVLAEKQAEWEAARRAAEETSSSTEPASPPQSSAAASSQGQKIVVKKVGDSSDETSSISNTSHTHLTKVEDQIFEQMNAYRKSLGLPELTRVSSLDECASIRVVEMLDNSIFSHTRPDGTSWETVLSEQGIKAAAWGEIQYRQRGKDILDTDSQMAAFSIDGWKTSKKGHDAIMRSKTYTKVGIGAYASGKSVWITDVVFIQ